ncbi:MAG: beta-N-acetylhexosaminidase [Opitutaceae bacterium]|nr:beta-N-acetylhexosaminidase [Opitutaceae bacterium]MBP9913280.1 beta-N-acetylhexosaminidase [Opitutaceae bacterium]
MPTPISIIPAPVSCRQTDGAPFALNARTVIVTPENPALKFTAAETARLLAVPQAATAPVGGNAVTLAVDAALASTLGAEGYRLTVTAREIAIRGGGVAGVFYGLQTLRQLLPPDIERFGCQADGGRVTVPAVEIEDRPRFGWRGAHLDVSRHFSPVTEVKKFIDLMVLHKLNVFHWHLVDDQGWRVEVKKYPKLTEIGAWRGTTSRQLVEGEFDGIPHGGFYTQDELREIVAYAAERRVAVMPEIEVPGHSSAALAAYPQFGNTDAPGYAPKVQGYWSIFPETFAPKPETLQFIDDVFEEMLAIFPSTFIHVGGDEAPKTQWETSPTTLAFMQANGLKDGHAMQSWFIRRTENFLAARGRRLVGWDEIQEGGLAPGATMMAWRDVKWAIEAARLGHDVVMAPTSHTYFDYTEGSGEEEGIPIGAQNTLARVYAFEPIPPELEPQHHHHVLGAQGQLWRERMPSFAVVERRAYPRLSALAEVVWSPREKRNYADFRARLPWLLARLDRLNVNYRRPRPGE